MISYFDLWEQAIYLDDDVKEIILIKHPEYFVFLIALN